LNFVDPDIFERAGIGTLWTLFFEDLKIRNLAVVQEFCYQQKMLVKTFQEV